MNGLLLTGTDTGVGKTVVAAAVVRLLRRQGHDCRVCKPVATGASQVAGRWLSEDTQRLAEAAGQSDSYERITPWVFPEPVAPAVAARLAGTVLTLSAVVSAVRSQYVPGGALIVEGIGGLLCPLTEGETVADLAVALGLPLVVVTRRSLGTLNHTLLTLEAASSRGLTVAGIVVNETVPPSGLADQTNVVELQRRIAVPLLGVVPFQDGREIDAGPALAEVDWWRLCQTNR
jgi:dethiobiotin synthetase